MPDFFYSCEACFLKSRNIIHALGKCVTLLLASVITWFQPADQDYHHGRVMLKSRIFQHPANARQAAF